MENIRKNLKVGILTFHRAINYGALLQAYALREVIQGIGCDCHVIDYHSQCIDKNYPEMCLRNCRTIKDVFKYAMYSNSYNLKRRHFREFLSKNVILSEPCASHEDLEKIAEQYDILISGSDQVWNYEITGFDKAYFLDFIRENDKKNAYAASFGLSQISQEYLDHYRHYLSNYNYISVREHLGRNMVSQIIGRDVDVSLDPTFLLPKERWEKVASVHPQMGDYILIYSFGLPQTLKRFAEDLSKKTGFPIVYIPVFSYSLRNRIKGTYKTSIGPDEYLGLFQSARYIVTNSFHGTAFSIIFNKPFFVEKKKSSSDNSRFDNIMDTFDLGDRAIVNGNNAHLEQRIDYETVNRVLEIEREKSIKFLEHMILG